jgi:hypothetical protein
MAERQQHGFLYQERIINENKLIENENYTGKWDGFNKEYNLPTSIKCISKKGSIDFGDFRRQTEVETDFILYLGFWEGNKENINEEYKVLIKKENWQKYFGDKTIIVDMLNEMKDISNDKSDDKKWKEYREKYSKLYGESIISLRFKRDHKKQKRIQCGITKKNFLNVILKENSLLEK